MDDVRARVPEIVLAAAPGAGKTEMSFGIIRRAMAERLASRVLVLAHGTTVLRRQFADRAVAELGSGAVYEHVPGKGALRRLAETRAPVIVALPQSMRRSDDVLRTCDLVIVDEAHEFYEAATASAVIASTRARSVVLLTGTPSKFIARGLPLHAISLHDVMKECPEAVCDPAIDLVSSEYLVEHRHYHVGGEIQKTFRFGREQTAATLDGLLAKMVEHLPRRRGERASGWHEAISRMGKTIIACRSVALARQVVDYFRKRGVNVGLSTHESDLGSEEIERFKDDVDMMLLIVVRRGVLGFSMPTLVNLVDMTGTIGIDRIFQMFARVVRPHPTKPKTRKLFVKMTPKGKMEAYTKDVMSAALQLGRKETFESFNGGNLGGIVIPRWRGDGVTASGPKDGGETSARSRKMRPLAKCFRASDFFDAIESMDSEFSPYAKTTLGEARARITFQSRRECSFTGCVRLCESSGLCEAHARQRRRGHRLSPILAREANLGKQCRFDGCRRDAKTTGLCHAHYAQKVRHGVLKDVLVRPRQSPICEFQGCGKATAAAGLCSGHYLQARNRGRGRLVPLRMSRMKGRICAFSGCGRKAVSGGLCCGHHRQRTLGQDLGPVRAVRPAGSPKRPCTFPGCLAMECAHRLCPGHYAQKRSGRELRPIARPLAPQTSHS